MVHYLKTWPEYFIAVKSGAKTFEIRKDDRGYKVSDILVLEEFYPDGDYTGERVIVIVNYLLDKQPFVPEGYVCMAIKII